MLDFKNIIVIHKSYVKTFIIILKFTHIHGIQKKKKNKVIFKR